MPKKMLNSECPKIMNADPSYLGRDFLYGRRVRVKGFKSVLTMRSEQKQECSYVQPVVQLRNSLKTSDVGEIRSEVIKSSP